MPHIKITVQNDRFLGLPLATERMVCVCYHCKYIGPPVSTFEPAVSFGPSGAYVTDVDLETGISYDCHYTMSRAEMLDLITEIENEKE